MSSSFKTITLCSSASFYRELLEIEKELKKMGYRVKIPKTAGLMKKGKIQDADKNRTSLKNKNDYKIKRGLIKGHFKKVLDSDAILVVNNSKNGIDGYLGGNVLMEMGVAFNSGKKIFLLNPISEKLPFFEEVFALNVIVLNNDLQALKIYLR